MEEELAEDEHEILEAREAFLLMHNVFYISRNVRALWFIDHLNQVVAISESKRQRASSASEHSQPESVAGDASSDKEIELLSAVPVTGKPTQSVSLYRITPDTRVIFLAPRYRLAFVLDISPSVASIDVSSSGVQYDRIISALTTAIRETIKPFFIPGYSDAVPFSPVIFITVIAHTPLINCKANQVILQGCIVTKDNVDHILETIRLQLKQFESAVADSHGQIVENRSSEDEEDDQRLTGGLFDDIIEQPVAPDPTLFLMTPEASFVNMLRYGILALQVLPENANGGIIVITDGIVGLPDANLFESLMAQLRHTNISCSFIQLNPLYQTQGSLGQVPYPDLMKFIATATFGAYFPHPPKSDESFLDSQMNIFHHAFLTWSFQKGLSQVGFGDQADFDDVEVTQDLVWTDRVPAFGGNERQWMPKLMRKKQPEKTLHLPLSVVISCRLREGYTIKSVAITKGESQIEVRLMLPWRDNVRILYMVASAWPLDPKRQCRVEVSIEASYDFLHDVTCPMKKPFKSPYRTAVVKKYWQALQGMSETDQLLGHLHSFNTNPINFTIPESIKQGVPLYILAANSSSPQLNAQFSSKDSAVAQFAAFWKPVLLLDFSIWQKWLHTHRIGLILEHDVPLAKYLHIPNSSGRYNVVTCRQAMTALNFFLRDWCTFVLMENHSYIKLSQENDKPPTSFYVVRAASKPPCIVLRLGFIGGTPCKERHEILNQLKEHLCHLNFPGQRGSQVEDKSGKAAVSKPLVPQRRTSMETAGTLGPVSAAAALSVPQTPQPLQPKGHKPPLQRLWSEIPCCKFSLKPIEKMLIKYERMPLDFSSLGGPPMLDRSGQLAQAMSANRTASTIFSTLSRYLYHQRWIWSVQLGSSMPIAMQAIGRILSNLALIRLQEGFNFAHTHSGIVNMVAELSMHKEDSDHAEGEKPAQWPDSSFPCIIQYIIFPPHTTTTRRDSLSEEETEPLEVDAVESDGELQIITECWVEPQYGVCQDNPPERSYLDGLRFRNIPHAMYPRDLECISAMVTFEHLNLMCQCIRVPSPNIIGGAPESVKGGGGAHQMHQCSQPGTSIQHVSFPFDLLRLLPKCQQVELLFSTLIQDTANQDSAWRPRAGTLTKGIGAEAEEGQEEVDPSAPNRLLIELFLEQLRTAHHREIHLANYECEKLMQLIEQRERNTESHPLPFDLPQSPEEAELAMGDASKGMGTRSESTLSVSTSVSIGSALTGTSLMTGNSNVTPSSQASAGQSTVVSQVHTGKLTVNTGRSSRVTSPLSIVRDGECIDSKQQEAITKTVNVYDYVKSSGPFMDEDVPFIPHWCCFIKSVSSSQVLLTFIPASFDDLRMLNRSKSSDSSNGKDEAAVKKDVEPGVSESNPDSLSRKTSLESSSFPEVASETSTTLVSADSGANEDKENIPPLSETAEKLSEMKAKDDEKLEKSSFQLPVYVYNCQLNYLSDQLVNQWSYKKLSDIFEDLKFQMCDTSEESQFPNVGEREKRISDSERFRADKEGSTVDSTYGEEEDLREHCTLVSETYLRCFVNGVYKSLLAGHHVDSRDVDTAINNICEEHLPVEVDISQFLHLVCGHIRQVVEKVRLDQMTQDDMMKTMPKLMHSPKAEKEEEGLLSGGDISPESPLPNPAIRFPLCLIMNSQNCESEMGLHKLIKNKFTQTLHKYFHPVPSNKDFYFYSPSKFTISDKEVTTDDQRGEGNLSKILEAMQDEPESDQKRDLDPDLEDPDLAVPVDRESLVSNKGSVTLSSYAEEDLDEPTGLDESGAGGMGSHDPLFLFLSCSVRMVGNVLRSISVNQLPTCLAEVKECLGDLNSEVNLNECQVTLDMICLTLPPEEDLQKPSRRPCYNRMTSYVSQMSTQSSHAEDGLDTDDVTSITTGAESGLLRELSDPSAGLPKVQQQVLSACKDEMKWLLTDEIASALRLTVPVTTQTLEMVAEHVKNSAKSDNLSCILEHVYLKFVYGPERSLTHFIEDFERMNLPGYHLNKEGHFYYLYIDRAHATSLATMAQQREITNALMCIENDADALSESFVLPPGVFSPGNDRKPLDSVKMGDPPTLTQDPSVVVLSALGDEDPMDKDNNDEFRAEDIKISIIRPSPVKEVPKEKVEMDFVIQEQREDKVEIGIGADNLSDSGSSIQVLDEKEAKAEDSAAMDRPDLLRQEAVTDDSVVPKPAYDDDGDDEVFQDDAEVKRSDSKDQKEVDEKSAERNASSKGSFKKEVEMALHEKLADQPLDHSFSHCQTDSEKAEKSSINIKRVHSSASFEKYKNERPKLFQTASTVEVSTSNLTNIMGPGRRSSIGLHTPSKANLASGLNTPLSTIGTQSRCSGYLDDVGYEGDSSDSDEDGAMMSFSESLVQRPVLPNFWLIMSISDEMVDVYFHTRDYRLHNSEADDQCGSETIHQRELYNIVITNITQTCRIVNQRLLLDELYSTRMCNTLLVPEADEDLRWTGDVTARQNKQNQMPDSDESDNDAPQHRYLAATMQFMPGHFACDCVWREHFLIHPRLKVATAPRTSTSHGIQTLRSVLNKFSVNNRKNMFVVKENNGAVFYLSLSESSGDVTAPPSASSNENRPEEDVFWSMSRSSSALSLSLRRANETEEEASAFQVVSPSRKSSTTSALEIHDSVQSNSSSRILMSQQSTRSIRAGKADEYVTLSAHGIGSVGPEISSDLVQLLQRKLDDSVLEILTLTLSRNPMCKLTSDDVLFIQRLNTPPTKELRLTIPASTLLQQMALGYYLRQNLLHFLFTPKYMDNTQVFCHYDRHGKCEPIPEENLFLYNRSQQGGGRVGGSSIACIHLSFVDGRGNPVQLLSSPKPSPSAYKEPLDKSVFDNLVHVEVFEKPEKSHGPGPTALVKFCIWERGQVDIPNLCHQLNQAMHHAVCDVIMEYRLLTVPLCKIPKHYARGIESPLHSAPPSPSFILKQEADSKASDGALDGSSTVKKQYSDGGRTPKEKSSFGAFVSDIFKTSKASSLGTPKEDIPEGAASLGSVPTQELDRTKRRKMEIQHNIEQYENGEKGTLHPVVPSTLIDWLEFCHSKGCPTVSKQTLTLQSRFPIDYILKDLYGVVNSICSDVTLRIFKRMDMLMTDSEAVYLPYTASRSPMTKEDKSESSLDLAHLAPPTHIPGKRNEYIVVGRNISLWRESMDYVPLVSDLLEFEQPIANKVTGPQKNKGHKTYFRFRPFDVADEGKRHEPGSPPERPLREFVPRQRLLLMTFRDKAISVYTYNWSGDTCSSLEKQMASLVNWHNARSHLMSWIVCQKAGLFDHCIFGDQPAMEPNQFIQTVGDVDNLVKCTSPPPQVQQRSRNRSGNLTQRPSMHHSFMLASGHPPSHLQSPNPFQSPALLHYRMYQGIKPPSSMHQPTLANLKDPIHRHGAQLMEMRARERRENDKRNALEKLYMSWQQRVSNPPIADEDLELLKRSSRLIHCVASPLLFSPAWRRKALGKTDPPKRPEPPLHETSKSRSRHGSGASMKSRRSDSLDLRSKKLSGGHCPDSPDIPSTHEESWHVDLKGEFVGQYMHYLQNLGFVQVQVRATESRRGYSTRSPRSSSALNLQSSFDLSGTVPARMTYSYLQKTFPGGIMLIELGFQEVYFCIHVYALECSRLPMGKTVNTSLAHIFTDECDKFKDLTHVHSFTHDFHLRMVQTYLSSPAHPIVFKPNYHITGFLTDFVKHYSFAPGFARNYIMEGSVAVDNTNSSGQQLFDYMLQHADKLHHMRPVRMTPSPDVDWDLENDCALVMQFEKRNLHEKRESVDTTIGSKTQDYDIGLIICHDPGSRSSEVMSLRLRFWLILTNRYKSFPKDQLEKKLGMFKSSRTYPATTQFLLPTTDPGGGADDVPLKQGKHCKLTAVKVDGQEITKLLVTVEDGNSASENIPQVLASQPSASPLQASQHIGVRQEAAQVRQESTNYLGYSNVHQTPIFNLLKEEAKRVREMILSMVRETMSRCRRDLLWQRMLLSNVADEEDRRRRHRPSDDDTKDPLLSKLTFGEFQELLQIVVTVPLNKIDPQLTILQNMGHAWYQGLVRVLAQRYRDEHRLFISQDGLIQHLVILNPNNLDMLMLVTVNSLTHHTDLCAVYREHENTEEHSPVHTNLSALAIHNHLESFVNTCCYHMWSSMIN